MFQKAKLVETLDIEGDKTRLSLTTLGKQNCIMNCNLFSQEADLPSVFSVQSLPVSSDSIPTREDVSSFRYPERSILISACLLDVTLQRPMKLALIKAKAKAHLRVELYLVGR